MLDRSAIRKEVQVSCLTLLLLLSGCATAPKQALDQSAAQRIQTIAVIEAHEPNQYVVMNFGNPGMMFGAIGGAIAGASMMENGTKFTDALHSNHFEIGKRLSEKTAEKLSALGYRVVRVPDVREIKDDKIILDYKKIHTDADAILNVTPTMVGYVSTHGFNDYIPAVGVIVELVSNDGKDQVDRIYQDHFMFGWDPSAGNWTHIPSPQNYSYSSFGDLMTRSADAGAGLLLGADLIADRLSKDLEKRH